MIIKQVGEFAVGTFGFPVEITLPDDITAPENANFLTGVTLIHCVLTRPDGSAGSVQDLALPGDIIDIRGVVRWKPLGSPMDFTINGVYTIKLTLTFPAGNLVADGDFSVRD